MSEPLRTPNPEYYCEGLGTLPQTGMGKVLVTGATGYIGGRLVPVLRQRGYDVRVMVRRHSREHRERFPGCEVVAADATQAEEVFWALKDVHTAYYLLHSLHLGQKRFEEVDQKLAANFRRAAEENGVKRIIYLTGLGHENAKLSAHLESRMMVARELEKGPVPVTLLRAGMIIGSGSASYEILHHLVKNTWIFFIPRWARTQSQPIAIRDVVRYLVGVLEIPETAGRHFDIGGPDILTYDEKLKVLARMLGLRRLFLPGLITWTPLYGYIASLLTPVPGPITKVLIEGCRNEVVCQNDDIREFIPCQNYGFQEALLKAMTAEEQDRVQTRWSDAYPPEYDLATRLDELNYSPHYVSSYLLLTHKSPASLFEAFCQIGGRSGWFHSNWMWRMRGALDRLMLGVGMSRGRRSSSSLRVNDVIDFWRVENLREDHLLLLRAEMKLPGLAWLEFFTEKGEGINRLAVTAFFAPRGWRGHVYWYMFVPFHYIIFRNLLKQIERRAAVSSSPPLAMP
ncbi:MAG TPA: SDR family oxidoreductase [Bacteroidales bacterium]|nr:SDR family oxidoreductase [Bacteroidales bacterium]HRZ76306.1 SDR family oxidoreductase [Bacteroidales bacterium]